VKPSLVKAIEVVRGDLYVSGAEQNIGEFVVLFLKEIGKSILRLSETE
jgi:hypothetical protein